MSHKTGSIVVHGKVIDGNTRCVHYHLPVDVIAIRFKCCNEYYPCFECHEEVAGHPAETWKKEERNTKAIYCGLCDAEMTIDQYMKSGNHCPYCGGSFNPNCSRHYHLYFEV